jgi:hypothetical protein
VVEEDWLTERVRVFVTEGERLGAEEREGDMKGDVEEVPRSGEEEADAVATIEGVAEGDTVSVALAVIVTQEEARGVPETVPVAGSKEGVDACVTLVVARDETVAPLSDTDAWPEALALPVPLAQGEVLGVEVSRAVPLCEGEAHALPDAVAEEEGDPVPAATEGVPAPPEEGVAEGALLRVARAGVAVALPELLCHALILCVRAAEGVAQLEGVGELLPEAPPSGEGVRDSVHDAEAVPAAPAAPEAVGRGFDSVGESEAVKEALLEAEGVAVRLSPSPGDRVGSAPLAVSAAEAVLIPRGLPVGRAPVPLAETVAAAEAEAHAEGVTVPTTEAEAEPLTVAVPHEVADAEGERLAVSLAVGVCDEDSDCVSEVDTEEEGVRAAEPLA